MSTVPAVPGFPVTLDGVTVLTDVSGNASFTAPVTDREDLKQRITLNTAMVPIGTQEVRVRADRVYSSGPQEARIALGLSYLVQFGFSGVDGAPVDASAVKSVRLKSEVGEILEAPAHEGAWLQGSRVVPRAGALEVKELLWSVQRVEYAGSNVVNVSQQRFVPAQQQAVDIELLFFKLDARVHDAIFDFAYGGAIELTYPDGATRRFGLDDNGQLSLPALPRGDYSIAIDGPGPSMPRPLAVSRDQTIELAFYSWLDIVVILVGIFGFAGGLAWAGRVRRRRDDTDGRVPSRSSASSLAETRRPTESTQETNTIPSSEQLTG
ncbi:hypothetical protein E4P39_11240 [Blastococcus sp. CT_GayMR19]|uniref:hypothetical protein n=1 Tax=Blastococcus sp. CT_GayMR19 TaxID=2559608 RepID=UPI001073DB8E|nr:hypothetical protein [Blastococcus sp. CT_GayMR19]TFV74838.1 hypothetical protein E4P39_11240 [Blastococcus sp. CT_GayMR19]